MGMVGGRREGIFTLKEDGDVIQPVDALQSTVATDSGMRCFSVWHWGSAGSSNIRWIGETNIGYVSRTLTKAEKNYSQLEKERLSCVFGIKKFHNYVFGRHFELVIDRKPLLGLLKENVSVSAQASPRVKRWSLFLSGYEYSLVFRNTSAHANSDALSRLPLPVEPATTDTPPKIVLLADHLKDSPVTEADI